VAVAVAVVTVVAAVVVAAAATAVAATTVVAARGTRTPGSGKLRARKLRRTIVVYNK